MRARLVVFPIKGRIWCFSRSVDPAATSHSSSSPPPPLALKDLWKKIGSGSGAGSVQSKVELVVDFVSDKMNRAWGSLGKAPPGTLKSRIHGVGLKLLSRVRPSEIFLKTVTKDVTEVDIAYPASLNPRLVRRRLRHIALRGSINHRRYFYGSVTLLPLTGALSVLPLPNVPFFWALFRAYSHWRALQGSERLLLLVSDCSKSWSSLNSEIAGTGDSGNSLPKSPWDLQTWKRIDLRRERGHGVYLLVREEIPWGLASLTSIVESSFLWHLRLGHLSHQKHQQVLQPSEELERLIVNENTVDGLSNSAVSSICKQYYLDTKDVTKYRNLL